MRRATLALLLAAFLPQVSQAQAQEWPDYTESQRWERMARLGTLGVVATLAYAKTQGTSLEEFGRWWGDLFAPSWGQPGSYGPFEVMRGMRRNFLSWPDMQFEILSQTETSVSARINRPWTAYFGEDETWYGVTLSEYETLNSMFTKRIAEYHGLVLTEQRDGEYLVMTFSRR